MTIENEWAHREALREAYNEANYADDFMSYHEAAYVDPAELPDPVNVEIPAQRIHSHYSVEWFDKLTLSWQRIQCADLNAAEEITRALWHTPVCRTAKDTLGAFEHYTDGSKRLCEFTDGISLDLIPLAGEPPF